MSAHIEVVKIPDEHLIVGYVASLKLLDENGREYWALRMDGLNNMEAIGMAVSMADDHRELMKRDTEGAPE